jgi:hypothetical protein
MRIYVSENNLAPLADAVEALPFSDELKHLLWKEMRESARFPLCRDGLFYCGDVAAPSTCDEITGFSGGDFVAYLGIGLAGEVFTSALGALKRDACVQQLAHSETPDLVAQSG